MRLEEAFSLAYGGVQGTSLDALEGVEVTQDTLYREMTYLREFVTEGLAVFEGLVSDSISRDKLDGGDIESNTTLYCMLTYLNRVQAFLVNMVSVVQKVHQRTGVDCTPKLRELYDLAKAKGFTLTNERVQRMLDTDADAEWVCPILSRGKVGFRASVSIIQGNDESFGSDDGSRNQKTSISLGEPIKTDFARRKGRKATGYPKFSVKDTDSETTTAPQSQPEEGETDSNPEDALQASKARRTKSGGIIGPLGRALGLNKLFCCCENGANKDGEVDLDKLGDEMDDDSELVRRQSSVALGQVQEIVDTVSDSHWHDKNRHKDRFNRIRARVPTGHPALFKAASNDMNDLLEEIETQDKR